MYVFFGQANVQGRLFFVLPVPRDTFVEKEQICMGRWDSYVRRAVAITQAYKGEMPLAPFLKAYFKENKQVGSTDRRYISSLVYSFYRLGHAGKDWELEEKILVAYFLCIHQPDSLLENLRPEWNKVVGEGLSGKLELLQLELTPRAIFPWMGQLSPLRDPEAFVWSHLVQPDLFIRSRPGYHEMVRGVLEKSGTAYRELGTAIGVPNNTSLSELLPINKAYVVQDYSSQRVAIYLEAAFNHSGKQEPMLWDCCAASGGKSILAVDINSKVKLTVSDVRNSILINLRKRFEEAGIRRYNAFVADLTLLTDKDVQQQYDVILADVPCSGAGTWGRTPEQLYFFEEQKIGQYAVLQRKILEQVIRCLKPGGQLVFVTCSVFTAENEANVLFLQERGLSLLKSGLLEGYEQKSDTMFAALLQKPIVV